MAVTPEKEIVEHVKRLAGPQPLLKLALKLTPRPIARTYAEAGRSVGADWAFGAGFNTGWEAGAREVGVQEHRRGYDAGQYDGYLMGRADGDRVGAASRFLHVMAGKSFRRGRPHGRWTLQVEPHEHPPFK